MRVHGAESVRIPAAWSPAISALALTEGADGEPLGLSSGGLTTRQWRVDDGSFVGPPLPVPYDTSTPCSLARIPGAAHEAIVVGRPMNRAIQRWNAATGAEVGESISNDALSNSLPRPPLAVVTMAGRPIVVASAISYLGRWDAITGAFVGLVWTAHDGRVLAVAATTWSDGRAIVVSGGEDGLVRRWDVETTEELGEPIKGCGTPVTITPLRWAGDRVALCVVDDKGRLHIRDLGTGEALRPPLRLGPAPEDSLANQGTVACIATATGGIAVAAAGAELHRWRIETGEPLGTGVTPTGAAITAVAAMVRADGMPLMLCGDAEGTICRLDARSGEPLGSPLRPHGERASAVEVVRGPGDRVVIVSGGSADRVRCFDAFTGERIGDPNLSWTAPGFIALTDRDGQGLLMLATPAGVRRIDLTQGEAVPVNGLDGFADIACAASVTLPDGTVIIGGLATDNAPYRGRLARWDATTGEVLGIGPGIEGAPAALAATTLADGRPVFAAGFNGVGVILYDARTGEPAGDLSRSPDLLFSLRFIRLSSGVDILVETSQHAVRQWDVVRGTAHRAPIETGYRGTLLDVSEAAPDELVAVIGYFDDEEPAVERRWLDGRESVDVLSPDTRAVFDHDGRLWTVTSQPDGTLLIQPEAGSPSGGPFGDVSGTVLPR